MIGVVPVIGRHIDRQAADVFLISSRIVRFQRGKLSVRKKNILKFSKTAEGFTLLVMSSVVLFLIILIRGQILPHARGRILHIHWAGIARWTGRNLHPVRDLQKDAVRLIPSLTDAGDHSGIFQLPQGGLDRPLTPVKIVCHLLDRIDHIHIPVLGHPAAFLGKHGAVEKQPVKYFEIELERRFHITPEQLSREFGGLSLQEGSSGQSEEDEFEFPTGSVKNWEALKKHAAQILSYASPTVYATVVRRIRVSRPQDDVRAYLMNMYRVNSSYRYACQLCHKPFSNVEMCQLEQKPDVELDPLNVCLCPNCAAKFRTLRNDKYLADRLIDSILDVSENEIEENDHVSVAINDYDFWFTPTHIAEIIELLKLKKKAAEERKAQPQTASKPNAKVVAKAPESNRAAPVQPVKEETPPSTPEPEEEGLQSDTSAYGELIGRRVFHKSKKAYARVVGCDGEYVVLNFESGDKAGQDVRYNLTMCLNNGWIEVVD